MILIYIIDIPNNQQYSNNNQQYSQYMIIIWIDDNIDNIHIISLII